MQKKSNPFDLVNIISVILGIAMIAVFIVWGNKRLEAVGTPTDAAPTASAGQAVGAPGVGAPGVGAPGVGAPGVSGTIPTPGGTTLPMGGSPPMPPTPGK